jgi:hypothetical protein
MRRFLAFGLMTAALSGHALACDVALPDHVRILDCPLAAAVAAATGRSATLRDLLDRIQRSDGLVFITQSPAIGAARNLLGGLSYDITRAGSYRMLRIFVSAKVDDMAMAIVGHELRHALEVLELSDACSEADVDALFDRLGWHMGVRTVETQAARDAGDTIGRELRAAKKRAVSER